MARNFAFAPEAMMSDDLVMLLRCTISRITAGTVPAVVAFLFLAQTPGFSTDCLGLGISIGGDGFPSRCPHEGEVPSFYRHASDGVVDASHSLVSAFFEFELTPDARGELTSISENAPAHEGSDLFRRPWPGPDRSLPPVLGRSSLRFAAGPQSPLLGGAFADAV